MKHNCGNAMHYVGLHYNDKEGWCSTFVCIKCDGAKKINKDRKNWNKHISKCKGCERCDTAIKRTLELITIHKD